MAQQTQIILYFHGFLSSPQSEKAQQMIHYCHEIAGVEVVAPQLPDEMREVPAFLERLVSRYEGRILGIMGSSLGGYYATYVSQMIARPAVLVNPAVAPFRLVEQYDTQHVNPYTSHAFTLDERDLAGLHQLHLETLPTPDNIWLLQQEGDEVLDFREAVAKYHACKQTVEPGGNHRFVGFERYLPEIMTFFWDRER